MRSPPQIVPGAREAVQRLEGRAGRGSAARARAAEQRPRWSVLARFEAEIDVLDGHVDDAIEHLRHAFELGDTDVGTRAEIARLLVIRGRGEEAKEYTQLANSAKGTGADSGVSEMLEVGIALAENDIPKAVKLIEQARSAPGRSAEDTLPWVNCCPNWDVKRKLSSCCAA